jgi:RNA polymerase sigma-70 factor (ECF subfamily)
MSSEVPRLIVGEFAAPPGADETETLQLVSRCIQGEEKACETLYRRYAQQIYRHLCLLLGPGAEAEDTLQSTFLTAFRRLAQFRGDSQFSTWLHGIALRSALNVIRARRRRQRGLTRLARFVGFDPTPASQTPERQMLAHEDLQQLDALLQRFSPDRQAAFLLYYVDDLDLGEVAARLEVAPGAVLKRIKRLRENLLASLAEPAVGQPRQRGAT